jgi:hypothetical protein
MNCCLYDVSVQTVILLCEDKQREVAEMSL